MTRAALLLLLLAPVLFCVAAEEPRPASLDSLLTQLASKDFESRESADRALKLRLTQADLSAVRAAMSNVDLDAEVKARLFNHLRRLELGFEIGEWNSADALAALLPEELRGALQTILQVSRKDSSGVGFAGEMTETWKSFTKLQEGASQDFWRAAAACNKPVARAYARDALWNRSKWNVSEMERALYDAEPFDSLNGCIGGKSYGHEQALGRLSEITPRAAALAIFARYLRFGDVDEVRGKILNDAGADLLRANLIDAKALVNKARVAAVNERSGALMALAMSRLPETSEILSGALHDRDPDIRSVALRAFEQLGDKANWEKMRVLAKDSNVSLQVEALRVGARFAGNDALPEIDAALQGDPAFDLRYGLAAAIGDLPDEAFLKRARAGLALASVGGCRDYVKRYRAMDKEKAAPQVLQIVRSGAVISEMEEYCDLALEICPPEECRKAFHELLENFNDDYRHKAALKGLIRLKNSAAAVEFYKEGLANDNPIKQAEAIKGLSDVGGAEATRWLEGALPLERAWVEKNPEKMNCVKELEEAIKKVKGGK